MQSNQVIIFSDEPENRGGWHGEQLAAALLNRGFEAVFASLQGCVLDLSGAKSTINILQFEQLPKAVFVRGIAGGSLQQITQRLNILHALKMLGVIVYNDGRAIERTVDKAMTSFWLLQNGIATPQTWLREIIQAHKTLVIKPLFGSQGLGVRLVEKMVVEKLPLPMDKFVDGVFYLQQLIKASHDYRVFVVNNKAVAAMQRTGKSWLHNVAQGATCAPCNEGDVLDIALQASQILEVAYCGVDVIRDENGQLLVLEVNSIPAWRGLQGVTQSNIAQILADDLLEKYD